MAFNPGRNVGRVSIRVVPDTTKFRKELTRDLDRMADRTKESITIDKARLDTAKIRQSIRTQLEGMKGLEADVRAAITVDGAKIKRKALQKSIQEQFDKMSDVRVFIRPEVRDLDAERFQKNIRDLAERASKNTVQLGVNAHTLAASQQLRYTTRPRVVEIFVKINQASLAAAVGTLAALSGARLSWKWIDDLISKMRDLDKNLPAILGWTTGITSLIASLFGLTSGLLGIGQGLFTILPAFLTLPGLLLNSVASLAVLVVALKHSKDELSSLGDSMNELGVIMRKGFWDEAREPIIELVTGLMPQLRRAFKEVSLGVGQFTGALADAFGAELANGRLESIFAGIAEGWRVLSTGAPAFAGAMTSLSQIAAKYTPRLAAWFVRQADTFDNWLTAISNDGRLGAWMEQAIDSMYDLWDATTGIAGVFEGLWRAAEAGGSGGLAGFADMMQEWERVTKSADFQKGLSAIFRGSSVAMDAFGSAVRAIGRMFVDMDAAFERFIGSAGIFFAGLIEGFAVAGNSPIVNNGINDLAAGLIAGLNRILPSLQPIADTFGRFLGLLGELASTLLPGAARVLADLMPAVDALIAVIEPVLQPLADALIEISSILAPAIEDFVVALGPTFQAIITGLAEALTELAPVIADLVEALSIIPEILNFGKNDPIDPGNLPGGDGVWMTRIGDLLTDYKLELEVIFKAKSDDPAKVEEAASLVAEEYKRILAVRGPEAGAAFLEGLASAQLPPEFGTAVREALPGLEEFEERGRSGGGGFSRGLAQGFGTALPSLAAELNAGGRTGIDRFKTGFGSGIPGVVSTARTIPGQIRGAIDATALTGLGSQLTAGMASGMRSWQALNTVRAAARLAVGEAVAAARGAAAVASPSRRMASEVGRWLPAGIAMGMDQNRKVVAEAAARMVDFDVFGNRKAPAGDGEASNGRPINITMPLLPGETPREQRDNLVEELKWVS